MRKNKKFFWNVYFDRQENKESTREIGWCHLTKPFVQDANNRKCQLRAPNLLQQHSVTSCSLAACATLTLKLKAAWNIDATSLSWTTPLPPSFKISTKFKYDGLDPYLEQDSDIIQHIIKEYPCSLAAPSQPHTICSPLPIAYVARTDVSTDVVFFNRKPFLSVMNNCAKWSETSILRTRRLQDLVLVLKTVQMYKHGKSRSVRTDQEYNKPALIEFLNSFDIPLIAIAAIYHEGNGLMEKANRSIKTNYDKLALAKSECQS